MINPNFRKDHIPMWINILTGIVILILLFKTYSCIVDPSIVYKPIDTNVIANQKVLWELAGRNIAMIIVTLMALRSQNALFLAFTMIINLVRESFDMMMGFKFSGGDSNQILKALTFLIFIVPYLLALKELRALAKQ